METEFTFKGTTDEFYTKLQEFASTLRAKGHNIYVCEIFSSLRGKGGRYGVCLSTEKHRFLAINTFRTGAEIECSLDIENHSLEAYASEIFAQLVVYMQPIEMQPIPMAETKESALKKVAHEADIAFNTVNDNWWRYILVFQNDWNQSHPRDRITNRLVADAAYVTEGTVKNKRTKLGFSTEIDTRTDLDNDAK